MLLSPNNSWRSVDENDSAYWSGLDLRAYVNGLYLEELVGIQYALQESVTPVYGYGSYTYDIIMRGSRLVQGALTVNFKEPGYLKALIMGEGPGTAGIIKSIDPGNVKAQDYAQTLGASSYQRKQELMQNLWGDEPAQTSPVGNEPLLSRGYQDHTGFDLVLKFGENTGQQYMVNAEGNGKVTPRLASSRALTLIGVQFQNVESMLDDSGKPVLESYQFIAKDIVYSVYDTNTGVSAKVEKTATSKAITDIPTFKGYNGIINQD